MEAMTVQQLIDELSKITKKNKKRVYIVSDNTENNYTEDGEVIIAYPVNTVQTEDRFTDDGWESIREENVLLMPEYK